MVDLINVSNQETPRQSYAFKLRHALSTSDGRIICLLFVCVTAWLILAQIVIAAFPDTGANTSLLDGPKQYLSYAMRNGVMFLIACGLVMFGWFSLGSRDLSIIAYSKQHYAQHKTRLDKIPLRVGLGLLSFFIFLYAYSTIKVRIPAIAPYSWDEAFFVMDRALFMGSDPWTVFAWIYDVPVLVRIIDYIYDVWAAILVSTWVFCFTASKYSATVRFRFPLALLLTWFIGGNLLAILLSSAGPCYYALITGVASDPYAAQMAQLGVIDAAAPLRAFNYQGILWDVYKGPTFGLGGISAMPSMHCATSFLLVLMAWRRPILRYVTLAFFAFIFITSFMLAWHYAVDGVLAVPIAAGAWWAAGRSLKYITRKQSVAL